MLFSHLSWALPIAGVREPEITMANFKPSDVFAFFPNSSFRKKEKEVLTAHIVRLLATEGDSWDKVVEWRLLLEHTRSAKMPHSGYENPFKKISLGERCGNAIWVLEETGFVEWGGEGVKPSRSPRSWWIFTSLTRSWNSPSQNKKQSPLCASQAGIVFYNCLYASASSCHTASCQKLRARPEVEQQA